MAEFTNEDFLAALREAQDSARRQGPANFEEYRQEMRIAKAPRGGGLQSALSGYSPGFGLMGSLNTNSRAPTGPSSRRSGNQATGLKQMPEQFGVPGGQDRRQQPSQYLNQRPNQPPPWIDDVDLASVWYSPMEPVWPFGPPNYTLPREWDFPVGYNLNYVPERLNLLGMLRGMRKSWGVLSTIIETRKDQLLRLPWTIQVRGKPRAESKAVDEMRKFFRKPDGKLSYSQWVGKYLDDSLVIDAPTLFMDRTVGGKVLHAQVLDGATIFPLIDDVGRRPDTDYHMSPNGIVYERRQPAYQQIIYGLPMVNLSEDEIIYGMRRPLPEFPVFGYSAVEQILTEATEAIRKTFYQLEFWRAGSMPEMIITVPDTWTPRQIATFQAHFDALLSGQLTLKSKVRFVPGGMKPFDIKNASGESLWSQRDELLVRLACYAFSVSPTPFVHQTNRATANQSQETAEEEGLFQLMSYWKDDVMDTIIQDKFGYDDVEFVFLPRSEPDQSKQATIHQVQLHDGLRTINEVRGELGLEPVADGDVHLIYSGNQVVRLDQVVSGEVLGMMPGAPGPREGEPKPAGPTGASKVPVKGAAKPANASPLPPKPAAKPTPVHKSVSAGDVKDAAGDAERKPSKIQQKVGNYPKGHLSLRGLKLTIENAKGSKRGEKDRFGVAKWVRMPAAYGYIRGTIGADNMQVDCYIGRHPESDTVWVVDQDKFDVNGEDKGFDEHKVFLAYRKLKRVVKDYVASHYDDMGHDRLAAITELTYEELKHWLKKGDMRRPISEQGVGKVVARRGKGPDGIGKADTVSQATGLLNYDLGPKRKGRKKRKSAAGPRWLELCA